eukprot:TRINITY_DN51280_c0_g1_i1.p1 TRINITY_DN51280_c0_g1~~TRINITY_DN51280_c0_g1_i1.p1  ORF type:complete len:273 (+),score=91.25 TRINITY_DN51280_c0_g1_i1:65-820(+)
MDVFRSMMRPFASMMGAQGQEAASRTARGFPAGKLMFRPQVFWQKVRPDHITPGGLEYNMSMDGGGNFARLKTGGADIASVGEYANTTAAVVPDSQDQGDGEFLSSVLREAAGSGDAGELKVLLQSCYVTRASSEPAVCEAAKQNQCDALRALLDAGCPPNASLSEKRALYIACESGAELAAQILVDSLNRTDVHRVCRATGKTAFEAAESQDLAPLAKRLRAYAAAADKAPAKSSNDEAEPAAAIPLGPA